VSFPILFKWLDSIVGDSAGAGKSVLIDEGEGDWNGETEGPVIFTLDFAEDLKISLMISMFKNKEFVINSFKLFPIGESNLAGCKWVDVSDKMVLEQCRTFFLHDNACEMRLKGKMQDHEPISFQDLQKLT